MNRLALERPNICVLRANGITLRDLSKKLFDRGMGSTFFTRKKSHGRKLAQKAGRDDRLRMDGIQNWKRNIRVGKHPDDKLVDDLIKLLIKRRFLFEFCHLAICLSLTLHNLIYNICLVKVVKLV